MSVDRAALDLVFNPEALESLTGAVRAGHLRFKPGTGLTATLLDADGAPTGWLRILADGAEKLDNARRRAERRSLTVEAAVLPERVACEERAARHDEGTTTAFWGPVLADPGLAKVLDEIDDSPTDSWQVLRYNPLRRLVVKVTASDGTPVAGRLTHDRQDRLRGAAERIARQVPTVARLRDTGLPESPRITWWAWCDGGDLSHSPSEDAVREAGRVTAQLHEVVPPPGDDIRHHVAGNLAANVELLTALDGDLGARLGSTVERLLPQLTAEGPAVTCHGDLSADQFFLEGTRVRLGDLDRVTAGPPAFDLGSFAATSPELLDVLLDGYQSLSQAPQGLVEGPSSTAGDLAAWTAYAHAIRALEPFRAANSDWREKISARIDTIEETLCSR
ncbi:phosphotransferase [Tessaracoccus massiliensis]|uniref:phosphotransferase n=1 Tax=Tessaracoccus massiliensis TaxID=1522311 RepID=UPI00058AC68C|nr:phosphotransferase [Tessaracoccus massiliensis]